jgi:hypothetical protein
MRTVKQTLTAGSVLSAMIILLTHHRALPLAPGRATAPPAIAPSAARRVERANSSRSGGLGPAAAGGADELVGGGDGADSVVGSDAGGPESPADCNCTLVKPSSAGEPDFDSRPEPNMSTKDISPLDRDSLDARFAET